MDERANFLSFSVTLVIIRAFDYSHPSGGKVIFHCFLICTSLMISDLKLNIQKTKIMVSGPIISWQIDGETMETVPDFIFLGFKITADGDCNHEIKDAPWKKSYDQPRQHAKKQRHCFADKVCLVKAMVFSVIMYGCENWTINKAECWRIDAFYCGAEEDIWESLGLRGDPKKGNAKECSNYRTIALISQASK